MNYESVALSLVDSLDLAHPPVGVAMADTAPSDVRAPGNRAPSACSFWIEAQRETFFASAENHAGCAVGAHVMGFPLSAATQDELSGAVTLMASLDYLAESEVGDIPRVQKSKAGAVYGPLATFPMQPDCVVVWVTPAQAMALTEALGTTRWAPEVAGSQRVFGRPGCGALAWTMNTRNTALSLGCTGMRTYTQIAPELALFVIPGDRLRDLAGSMRQTTRRNSAMLDHYMATNGSE